MLLVFMQCKVYLELNFSLFIKKKTVVNAKSCKKQENKGSNQEHFEYNINTPEMLSFIKN